MNFHRFDRKNNPYGDAIRPIYIPILIVHIHAAVHNPPPDKRISYPEKRFYYPEERFYYRSIR